MSRENVEYALEQLRQGRPIILMDDVERECEGDLAFAAKYCTPELVNLALTIGRGLLCISMPPEKAEQLGVTRLNSNGKDSMGTPFGMPISVANGNSGISASDRCETIRATCRPDAQPSDFCMPGHVSTLIAHPKRLAGRDGHTEAILDILSLAGIEGCGVLCEILNPDGTIAKRDALEQLTRTHNLAILDIGEVIEYQQGG